MNIGPAELLVIILFAFIIVGPERLPKAGRAIGNALRKLRDTQGQIDQTLKDEGLDPKSIQEASRNPFLALEKIEKVANAIPHGEDETDAGVDDAADDGDSSKPEDGEEHKPATVSALTDMETFTERKARLTAEAEAGEAASGQSGQASELVAGDV